MTMSSETGALPQGSGYMNLIARYHRPLFFSLLLLIVEGIGVGLGRMLLPQNHPGTIGVANRLLSWDGRIYFAIMRDGYSWDPIQGIILHHYQSIAFFPLQPVIDRLVSMLSGGPTPLPVLIVTFAMGVASIFAFAGLSNRLLPPRAAAWATALFTLWPGACFYIMGYPTGLISLCIILALNEHLRQRYWISAFWFGIGTAAAPTVVFVIAALGIDRARAAIRSGVTSRRIAELAGWGLVCISGLLGFMLYQQLRYHDAFAFIEAQAAWGTAPPFFDRLSLLTDWHRYIQQPHAGLNEIHHGLSLWHKGSRVQATVSIEAGIQRWINAVSMIVVIAGLIAASRCLRGVASIVSLAGWFVLAGYAWFIFATDQNMLGVPRLLFPAIATFLGLGVLVERLPVWVARGVVAVLAAGTMLEVAFAASGYWVV